MRLRVLFFVCSWGIRENVPRSQSPYGRTVGGKEKQVCRFLIKPFPPCLSEDREVWKIVSQSQWLPVDVWGSILISLVESICLLLRSFFGTSITPPEIDDDAMKAGGFNMHLFFLLRHSPLHHIKVKKKAYLSVHFDLSLVGCTSALSFSRVFGGIPGNVREDRHRW